MKEGKQLIRTTGFEFASYHDLKRDEAYARYIGDRRLLFRVLMEKQHRRWTDEKREQCFLTERFYPRVGHEWLDVYRAQLYMYTEPMNTSGNFNPID